MKQLDQKVIKNEAKEIVKNKFGTIWLALGINFIISFLYLLFFNLLIKDPQSNMASAISLLYNIITIPFSFGLSKYLLTLTRKEEPNLKDLIYYYRYHLLDTLILSISLSIIYSLGLSLFIFPLIILFLMFGMAENVLIDGTYNLIDALSGSYKLINGYKWDYFNFLISFILWFFLGIVTLGIGFIWVLPYFMIAQRMYYVKLVELQEKPKRGRKKKSN